MKQSATRVPLRAPKCVLVVARLMIDELLYRFILNSIFRFFESFLNKNRSMIPFFTSSEPKWRLVRVGVVHVHVLVC